MAACTKLDDQDIRAIADCYGLVADRVRPMVGGAANSSFLLHTNQGQFVLTVFDEKSQAAVENLGRVLLLLEQRGFPATRVLSSRQGAIATRFAGKPVMVKPYIEGTVVRNHRQPTLFRLGQAMARLHQVPVPEFLGREHAYGVAVFRSVIGRGEDKVYESWLAERAGYLECNIPSGLPRGLIHGDLFYDNALFDGDRLKAVIDFEEACCYFKVFDLGMAVAGNCTTGEAFDLEKAASLLAGYRQVRVPEPEEQAALQLFVLYAATATSYWRYWKYHTQTSTGEYAHQHWEMARLADAIGDVPAREFQRALFR